MNDSQASAIRELIALGICDGVSRDVLHSQLFADGYASDMIASEIDGAFKHPYVQAVLRRRPIQQKMAGLLDLYAELWQASAENIDEVSDVSEEIFLSRYYFRNRPLIIRNCVAGWPAVENWSFEYLSKHYGEVPIEYVVGDDRYGTGEKLRSTLADLIARIHHEPVSNQYYLIATNFAFRSAPDMLRDGLLGLPFLGDLPISDPDVTRLWLGPRATITPLHHDTMNIIFAQIFGKKQFLLAPPFMIGRLANEYSVFSSVDPISIHRRRFAEALNVRFCEVDLNPGDVLFIPAGWWHWVYALTSSISVGFSNFEIQGHIHNWPNAQLPG